MLDNSYIIAAVAAVVGIVALVGIWRTVRGRERVDNAAIPESIKAAKEVDNKEEEARKIVSAEAVLHTLAVT